jgi:hypothetical protein
MQTRQDKLHLLATHYETWTKEEQACFMYDKLWEVYNLLTDTELDERIKQLGLSENFKLFWSLDDIRKAGL